MSWKAVFLQRGHEDMNIVTVRPIQEWRYVWSASKGLQAKQYSWRAHSMMKVVPEDSKAWY